MASFSISHQGTSADEWHIKCPSGFTIAVSGRKQMLSLLTFCSLRNSEFLTTYSEVLEIDSGTIFCERADNWFNSSHEPHVRVALAADLALALEEQIAEWI